MQVAAQQSKVNALSTEATKAEQLSAEAMHSAEAAVMQEMEAMTVARDISDAFNKSLVDLQDLGATFKVNAQRSSEEQAKAQARALVSCWVRQQASMCMGRVALTYTQSTLGHGDLT